MQPIHHVFLLDGATLTNLLLCYVVMVTPTCTLCSISGVSGRTRSTCVSTYISWRRKIVARYSCVTRLSIHFAGVNVAVTEPSRVASLTCASHVNKLTVRVSFVTFFRRHTLTIVIAGTHVNLRTPGCAGAFVISSDKRYMELKIIQAPSSLA